MSAPLAPVDDFEAGPAPLVAAPWPFLAALPATLNSGGDPVAAYRGALAEGEASLKARFGEDEPVDGLVRDRARVVDVVLRSAWQLHVGTHTSDVNLIAVFRWIS